MKLLCGKQFKYFRHIIAIASHSCISSSPILDLDSEVFHSRTIPSKTRAITKRDHTPQQLLVTKQINVTGMQNKKFHERAITQ